MKTISSASTPRRGSAFVTVMMFTCVMFILSASLIKWSLTERRLNMRNASWLEARNGAEAVAEYGFAQIVTQFNANATPPTFDPTTTNALSRPSDSFFSGGNVVTGAYDASSNPYGIELIGGTAASVPSSGALYFVDPKNPDNQYDTLVGQYVYRRDVVVLARATVRPTTGGPITAYVTEKVSIRGAPLFSHAIFYSANDLEIFPGPVMNVYGPVHCNSNLFLSSQGNSLNFYGPVSAAGNLYHAWSNSDTRSEGTGGETIGQTPVNFINSAGTLVNQNNTGASTGWRDSTMGASNGVSGIENLQPLVTATSNASFRSAASQTWNGNLQTGAHGVQAYYPISFNEIIDAAGDKPDPHALIDAPDTTLTTSDAYYSAKKKVEDQKMSMQSGLYIKVTVAAGAAGAADTLTSIDLYGPAGSAAAGATDAGPNGGAKLGAMPANLVKLKAYQAAATGTATQPATKVTTTTVAGTGGNAGKYKWSKTTTTGGTWTQSVTRTYNGTGSSDALSGGSFSGGSSNTVTDTTWYSSQAAALAAAGATGTTPSGSPSITIDTSTYSVTSGFYDQRRDKGIDEVQLDMTQLRKAVQEMVSSGSSGSTANAIKNADGTAWTGWNGAVYVDIVSPNYQTSSQTGSLSLVNGTVASGSSLIPSYGPNGKGLTIATNAPAYIKGVFNADGSGATTTGANGPATTPDDGNDGSSGHASAESPVCIAADSVTILSPNWNDANSFSSSPPTASDTEVAAALLVGLVKTTASASSGGAHNLPRFLENWSGKYATIRGSLVTMYNCKVSTEPWNTSFYSPPNRNWGFDKIFKNGNYPPITPKVMSYRRVDFTDLSAAGYAAARHALWPTHF